MRDVHDVDITPEQFELQVRNWVQQSARGLEKFSVHHLKKLDGDSGEYEIDVTAEFVLFGGAEIKILIECKKYNSPVKRDVIMIMESKIRDSSAHKGMVFSTSGFQSGAIEYAQKRGIATITLQHGHTNYFTKSTDTIGPATPSPWIEMQDYIGWFITVIENKSLSYSVIDNGRLEKLKLWINEIV